MGVTILYTGWGQHGTHIGCIGQGHGGHAGHTGTGTAHGIGQHGGAQQGGESGWGQHDEQDSFLEHIFLIYLRFFSIISWNILKILKKDLSKKCQLGESEIVIKNNIVSMVLV